MNHKNIDVGSVNLKHDKNNKINNQTKLEAKSKLLIIIFLIFTLCLYYLMIQN